MCIAWLSAAMAASPAEKLILDPSGSEQRYQLRKTDAEVLQTGSDGKSLRIRTGTSNTWPGVSFVASNGDWDLSAYGAVEVVLRNVDQYEMTVFCRVDNDGANGTDHCLNGSVRLGDGETQTLRIPLKRTSDDTLGGKLFGMRGYPARDGGRGAIDPARINQILLFVSKPATNHVFDVLELRATGSYVRPTAFASDADPFIPFIDELGQYRHKTWPGKRSSLQDLRKQVQQEQEDLAKHPGPANWNRYGGNSFGPQLKATGYFRTEKYKGKWWLVDPEGRQFFSHGIDCVGMANTTAIEGRASWFHNFPGNDPEFREFFRKEWCLKGHFAEKTVQAFDFSSANLKRKFGSAWPQQSADLIQRRLRSWGINTIGNWSSERVWRQRKTPYTDTLGSNGARQIEGSEGYWGKFPDVFDSSFNEALQRSMDGKKGKSAGDPWCIGYFSDNEMSWGDEISLAVAALRSGKSQPAKAALVGDLRAQYSSVAVLNKAWGADYRSWDDLLNSREFSATAGSKPDLLEFYTKCAEHYFRTVRNVIKASSPQHLYLGCRFAWANQRAAAAAAKYCDVVSYNIYERSVENFRFNGGADVPLIIGEFHFGALDRGMFHTGLVPVADQNARADAYREYVLGALKHPQIVGTHWFQYQDEATTGRVYDEENYQIGFVDITDTPYPEMVSVARQVAAALYSNEP